MKRFYHGLLLAVVSLAVCIFSTALLEAIPVSAVITEIKGDVTIKKGNGEWKKATEGMTLPSGTNVKTGAKSSAVLKWSTGNTVKLTSFTNMAVSNIEIDPRSKQVKSDINLATGKLKFKAEKMLNPNSQFNVKTPTAVAGVRGTTGDISNSADGTTEVLGRSGLICVMAGGQEVCVGADEYTMVQPGGAPIPPTPPPANSDACETDDDCMSGKCADNKCVNESNSFNEPPPANAGTPPAPDPGPATPTEPVTAAAPAPAMFCSIDSPTPGQRFPASSGPVKVTGKTLPNAGCSINGIHAAADASGVFTGYIEAVPGIDAPINVSCSIEGNSAGAACSTSATVAGAPMLEVFSPITGFKDCPLVQISGIASPNALVTVNGIDVSALSGVTRNSDGSFNAANFRLDDCYASIEFKAVDEFNQITVVSLTSGYKAGEPITQTYCGDGVTGAQEQCDDDDANTDTACAADYGKTCTYCSTKCVLQTVSGPSCGDGVCTAANEDSATCPADCSPAAPVCGNGTVESGEICDNGASNTATPCTAAYGSSCTYCTLSCQEITVTGGTCGDGSTQLPEKCDNGASNTDTPCTTTYGSTCTYCNTQCAILTVDGGYCGDGSTQLPEKCDNGAANTDIPCTASYGGTCTYCNTQCAILTASGGSCGDSSIQSPETCDDGAANTETPCTTSYGSSCTYCNTACISQTVTGSYCGDSITDSGNGETCDDGAGNTSTPCTAAYSSSCSYCDSACQTQTITGCFCGDSVCNTPDENSSLCPTDCYCGDGVCDPASGEDAGTCYADCGSCGDSICSSNDGEDDTTCYADCGSCGDYTCTAGQETDVTCYHDCGYCEDGICTAGQEDINSCYIDCGSCGDAICTIGQEDSSSCPADCSCGDSVCDTMESSSVCPADCFCGNTSCDIDETDTSCYTDCGSCGDASCTAGYEDVSSCEQDCFACEDSVCSTAFGETPDTCYVDCGSCGDSICTMSNEDVYTCEEDCHYCGDTVCSAGYEDDFTCYTDCGFCGNGICEPGGEDSGSCPSDCTGQNCTTPPYDDGCACTNPDGSECTSAICACNACGGGC